MPVSLEENEAKGRSVALLWSDAVEKKKQTGFGVVLSSLGVLNSFTKLPKSQTKN